MQGSAVRVRDSVSSNFRCWVRLVRSAVWWCGAVCVCKRALLRVGGCGDHTLPLRTLRHLSVPS